MAVARDVKLINTSGRDGLPAPEFFESRAPEAPIGQSGLDGRSAGSPTAGTPGTDIRIRLAYSTAEPGVVQTTGEGGHTGQLWKIARNERLLLKARGGSGGAGGRGENGQAGGRGRNGRDATKHHVGEDGGDGGRGGDGGAGSDGADGAPGGNVFVTVHEDDTDLLIPLEYDVSGGEGGASGTHGEPGDGGRGGKGGSPYAWSDGDRARAMDGGHNGHNGPPGNRPSTYLSGGKSAPHGSIQIKVIRGDLSEATYPNTYILEVVKFDIIDENGDGVNEPGEHILVHNIRVRNVGGMPTPATRSIHILVQGTQWLEPVASEPIELPFSIQPGQEVDVPGVLRAYIRNEWSDKAPGALLFENDFVQLVAVFHERLNRPIPNFCGNTPISIRYPIRLDPPTYLDCVAKGDKVRFKWVLHNDSTKAFGIDGALKRACATKLSDPQRFFVLMYATEDKPDEAIDELDEVEPNSMVTIDQEFSVNDQVMEFSDGFLTLDLLLADPQTGHMRTIQKHHMRMQISGIYSLSPEPSYLLVVNSSTPNHAIHQIIQLLRNRMHTKLDIFNLSLTGSYESPVTQQNVLKSYLGKTIVIFANSFLYFSKETKNPWELLDPWETALLLKGGTSVLFANATDGNLPSLQSWASHATFPAHEFATSADSINDENAKAVAQALRKAGPDTLTGNMAVHRFPVTHGGLNCFSTLESTVDKKAASAAKTMTKNIPLRRFAAVPDLEAMNGTAKTGGVVICEGVPRTAKMIATIGLFGQSPPGTNTIADYDMYFIVSSLPFAVRARMFWNIVGRIEAAGVPCDVLYRGAESFLQLPSGASPDSTFIDEKLLHAIGISLQFDLNSEIYCFTGTQPRFPDPIPTPEKLSQMPLTSLFFSLVPQSVQITDIAQAQILISTLGSVHALANPLSFWQSMKSAFAFCGNRKGQLTSKLNERIFLALEKSCAPDIATTVKDHIMQRSKQVKAGIRAQGGPKNFSRLGQSELATFTSVTAVAVHDLTLLQPVSVAMNSHALGQHQTQYHVHRHATETLKDHAKTQIQEMVNAED